METIDIDIFNFFFSPSKTAALFSKAIALHIKGKLQEAMKEYQKIFYSANPGSENIFTKNSNIVIAVKTAKEKKA